MHIPRRILSAVLLVGFCAPVSAWSADVHDPAGTVSYTQEFLITAYYSPKENQCCYVTGSYEGDRTLNGNGTHGASGVAVHPGMAAAPKEYPFGTRVTLPGIGTITVQDRGGAIHGLADGVQRLDLWAGEGEEGLARALAFGMQRVTGTVYPESVRQPAESLSLSDLPSPIAMILPYALGGETLLAARPQAGDRGLTVKSLQQNLTTLGYFDGDATGFFGPQTQRSLRSFLKDYLLTEPDDAVTERTAATILAAIDLKDHPLPIAASVTTASAPSVIRDAQRTLRFLGYYRGRTNGVYDHNLRTAIAKFQKEQSLIASYSDAAAGTVGPRTRSTIARLWLRHLVSARAEDYLFLARIDALMASKGYAFTSFVGAGDSGADVRRLQSVLAGKGLLGKDRVTGYFGAETERALTAYQLERGIIRSATERGAGYAGPGTKRQLVADIRMDLYRKARAEGIDAL
jgi:peptidoglycan hydrolase-like protein with peptidoglycan-binding domain/3D (Asp-Asp-Asp) domain-containing protein